MASSDTFSIKVLGKGGHGGLPHETIDPIIIAYTLLQSLQTIISKNVSPFESGVISFGSIHGGDAANVIPNQVVISGTIRTFQTSTRPRIVERIEEIINGVSQAMKCKIIFENSVIAPSLINNNGTVNFISKKNLPKFKNTNFDDSYSTMVSEDFSYFSNQLPGCFMLFRALEDINRRGYGHHHPKFDIDEDVLLFSIEVMGEAVFDIVQNINSLESHR